MLANLRFLSVRFCFLICIFTCVQSVNAEEIDARKSLMITDSQVLNNINQEYDFAYNLGEVSVWLGDKYPQHTALPGNFITSFFDAAVREQRAYRDYDALYTAQAPLSLGAAVPSSRLMNDLYSWKSRAELNGIKRADIEDLRNSPFRLLAVANLLDHAGDIDDRGLPPTTWQPRALGELHLVYGFVDEAYETEFGVPYPQTWVLSYRVPAIHWNRILHVENDSDQFQMDLVHSQQRWSYNMRLWAKFWQELSELAIESAQYESHLREILDLVVQPQNFLNVRSNTKITDAEFEIREFYINPGSNYKIVLRKPRREPYPCIQTNPAFQQMIQDYWRDDYEDLDVTTYVTSIQEDLNVNTGAGLRAKGYNGFTIPRTLNLVLDNGAQTAGECGHVFGEAPYKMHNKNNSAKALTVAPFARLSSDFVWDVPGLGEPQRHAFAIRTCSGCHSGEGAATGFHIAPRLANEESVLSPFLTGEGDNTFTKNGVTYEYNELEKRKVWMQNLIDRTAVIFDSLKRDDIASPD